MPDQSNEILENKSNNPVIFQPDNLGNSSNTEVLNSPSIKPIQGVLTNSSSEILDVNPVNEEKTSGNGPVVFDPSNGGGQSSSSLSTPTISPVENPTSVLEPVIVEPLVGKTTIPTANNGGVSPTMVANPNTTPTVSTVSSNNPSGPVLTPVTNGSFVDTNNVVPRESVGIINQNVQPNPNGANPMPRETPVKNLKKVEVEYKPPGKFKTFILIVFLVGLILFVIYLPQVKEYVENYQNRGKTPEIMKITSGKLKCSLQSNTKTLDKNYDLVFYFTDNKLERTEFTITTKGDPTADEEELNKLEASCKLLESESENLDGLYVKCSNKTGILKEIQNFDLSKLDSEKLDSAFVEAGANNPEYQYGQDMDRLEQNMNASGYSCKREG